MQNTPKYLTLIRVKQIVAASFIIGKLFSLKLWFANRTFPTIPVFDVLKNVPNEINVSLFFLSLVVLAVLIVFPSKNKITYFFIGIEIISIMLDETRLQAWTYEYLILLFPFAFLNKEDAFSHTKVFTSLVFILAATYFWGGFFKFNHCYILTVWKSIFNLSKNSSFLSIGYFIPFFESVFAIGLFFKQTKRFAAMVFVIMHIFILVIYGPLGINYNGIIWPWNISMMAILGVLFFNDEIDVRIQGFFKNISVMQISVLFFCVVPVLNIFNCWSNESSFKLYTGDTKYMYVCFKNNALQKADEDLKLSAFKRVKVPVCNGEMLSLKTWSLNEINVMPHSDEHYFNQIKSYFFQRGFTTNEISFWIHESPYDSTSMRELK